MRSLLVGLLLTAVGGAGMAGTAGGAPVSGTLITLTLISDVQVNDSLVWFDGLGALRHQSAVPLSAWDDHTRRWSASLTFTRDRDVAPPPLTAMFVSGGRFAKCIVTADEQVITEDSDDGPEAIAVCD